MKIHACTVHASLTVFSNHIANALEHNVARSIQNRLHNSFIQAYRAGCAWFHYSLYSSALVAMDCCISCNDTLIKPLTAAGLLSPVYKHKFWMEVSQIEVMQANNYRKGHLRKTVFLQQDKSQSIISKTYFVNSGGKRPCFVHFLGVIDRFLA